MTKTDRDTLRSLHGRKKWEHIWAYYKLPIAIVLIVVYILGYAAYRHVTKKEDVLYLGLVNITAGSDLTEQLTTGFAEAQGLTKKQQVDLRTLDASFHAPKSNRSACCPACCSAKANAQRSSMYMLRR